MYVIKSAIGNIYPVEKCVYRIGAATGGGYKLTHLELMNVSGTPDPALDHEPTAATAGDLLGYLAKTGRFVAITEPAT
tara:strand:- start:255 stop:488 length:234 start_codon:yes stop_codon:yes gene_type:complete